MHVTKKLIYLHKLAFSLFLLLFDIQRSQQVHMLTNQLWSRSMHEISSQFPCIYVSVKS